LKRYQRGFLRKEKRASGEVWVYRFRQTRHSDGKRVERNKVVGPVGTIGKSEGAAWKEVERLHMQQLANEPEQATAPTFRELAMSYVAHEVPRLAFTTQYLVRHNLDDYLIPKWGKHIAADIEPLQIERWLKELNQHGLANPTTAKIRGNMLQVFKHSQRVGLISRGDEANPVKFARASSKSAYKATLITPAQAFAILKNLPEPERTLALLSAATGLRISESLGLQWSDVDFVAQKITVKRTWLQGRVGEPKTSASAAPVPMHPLLGEAMLRWRAETPYAGESDWVFASFKLRGKQPREGNMIGADYLRPAAVRAGVLAKGDKGRFGWHNFRHSLASFLVASGTDTKTVQELLRHAKVQTTLDLYSQSMSAERMVAQGNMLTAIFGQSLPAEN
jgi:integrase